MPPPFLRRFVRKKKRRIAVIGGGASGLSAAYFLGKKNYENVTVFEKTERTGGKCRTFQFHGKNYEQGAFTITKNYKKVHHLLKGIRFELCDPPKRKVVDMERLKISSMGSAVRQHSKSQILMACFRYLKELIKYRRLHKPGFAHVDKELAKPFTEWANEKNIYPILLMFHAPITLFGYGYLSVIPAVYVLKCMPFWSFVSLMMIFLFHDPGTQRIVEGYGRIWERLAMTLDIRVNAKIKRIERGHTIKIHVDQEVLEFDSLIISCPVKEVLEFLDCTDEEKELFSKVKTYNYFVTAFRAEGLPSCNLYVVGNEEQEYLKQSQGHPWAIYKPWEKHPMFMSYTFADHAFTAKKTQELLIEDVARLGGQVLEIEDEVVWKYFPHVSGEEIANGFYDRLEKLHGKNHTYYTGSTFAFETVEDVVCYSRRIVKKYF